MKSLAGKLIVAWGLTFVLALRASAQVVAQPDPGVVQPGPVTQQPDPGVVQPGPVTQQPDDAARAERRAADRSANQPWALRLGVNELSETNVQPGVPQNNAGLGSQLDAALAYNWARPGGGIKFNGNVNQLYYRDSPSLNEFLYGAGASASYVVSRRTSWTVSDTLTSSYAQDLTAISAAGLLPPKLVTRVNTASTGLSYGLSARTTIRWAVAEQSVTFDSSRFPSASTFSTSVSIGRQLSRSQTVGVTGDYQYTVSNGTTASVEGLLGTWQEVIGKRFSVNASAGMRPYTAPGQSGFRIAPALSAGLNLQLRQNDTLGLHYERSVIQGFGNPTNELEGVAATYALSLRRLAFNAGGTYGRGTYPLDPSRRSTGLTGTVGARFVLVQNLALALASSAYERSEAPAPAITLYRTTMSLIYGRTWR